MTTDRHILFLRCTLGYGITITFGEREYYSFLCDKVGDDNAISNNEAVETKHAYLDTVRENKLFTVLKIAFP